MFCHSPAPAWACPYTAPWALENESTQPKSPCLIQNDSSYQVLGTCCPKAPVTFLKPRGIAPEGLLKDTQPAGIRGPVGAGAGGPQGLPGPALTSPGENQRRCLPRAPKACPVQYAHLPNEKTEAQHGGDLASSGMGAARPGQTRALSCALWHPGSSRPLTGTSCPLGLRGGLFPPSLPPTPAGVLAVHVEKKCQGSWRRRCGLGAAQNRSHGDQERQRMCSAGRRGGGRRPS